MRGYIITTSTKEIQNDHYNPPNEVHSSDGKLRWGVQAHQGPGVQLGRSLGHRQHEEGMVSGRSDLGGEGPGAP